MVVATFSVDSVPRTMARPFILTGYRGCGVSVGAAALSVFRVHNESLNIGSHLFGLLWAARQWQCSSND